MPGTRSMPGAQAPDAATRPLRIGVIGVGRIGRMHAELLARRVVGAALAMVHDVTPAAADAAGAEFGVPVAASADELLRSDDVDAVANCSSVSVPPAHAEANLFRRSFNARRRFQRSLGIAGFRLSVTVPGRVTATALANALRTTASASARWVAMWSPAGFEHL